MEKRKARIDTDVMERFVPSCRRCVNSMGYGDCPNAVLQFWGLNLDKYFGRKLYCKHFKRKV